MAAASNPKVLVVEDEQDLADLYGVWLADDYTVEVVYQGETALEALDDEIDVVLLDRRIPDLSGDEILAEIRDRELSCRVAMVSAVTPAEDILEMGFDDYLVKPVSREDLHSVVERLLKRSAHSEEVQEFFALASKKAVLEAEGNPTEEASSNGIDALETSLEEKSEALASSLEELDETDFEALFHDLNEEPINGSA